MILYFNTIKIKEKLKKEIVKIIYILFLYSARSKENYFKNIFDLKFILYICSKFKFYNT